MFRDSQVAQHEREMAEMRARLDAEKGRTDQLKMEADKMREKAEALEMERSLQPGRFKRFLDRMTLLVEGSTVWHTGRACTLGFSVSESW